MANVATRLISIILMLQRRGTLKASELAEELGVSERTIHRYMGMLDELGIPIYSERGPYGGFSLVRGYRLPPLIFTPEEATALYLGAELVKDIWGASYFDAAVAATAKLDNVLPDTLLQEVKQAQRGLLVTGWLRRDYGPWAPILDDLRRAVARRRQLQVVYQSFQLLPMLTLVQNVMLPMDMSGLFHPRNSRERALALLEQVELSEHVNKYPTQISGGQQQRVAIARALANDPPLIVADEPTGSLDSVTADHIFDIFQDLLKADRTIIMVTHDQGLMPRFTRYVEIADGELVNERRNP